METSLHNHDWLNPWPEVPDSTSFAWKSMDRTESSNLLIIWLVLLTTSLHLGVGSKTHLLWSFFRNWGRGTKYPVALIGQDITRVWESVSQELWMKTKYIRNTYTHIYMYTFGHLNDLIYVYIFLCVSVTPGKAKDFFHCVYWRNLSDWGFSHCLKLLSPPNQWLLVNQEFQEDIEVLIKQWIWRDLETRQGGHKGWRPPTWGRNLRIQQWVPA